MDAPVPSAEADGICERLSLLWETNKCLFIGLLVALILIVLGIIFIIIWFVILKKGSSHDDHQAAAQVAAVVSNQAHLTLRGLTTATQ